jgi:hypothetical protein
MLLHSHAHASLLRASTLTMVFALVPVLILILSEAFVSFPIQRHMNTAGQMWMWKSTCVYFLTSLSLQAELLSWMLRQPQAGKVILADGFYADGILEGLARHGLY